MKFWRGFAISATVLVIAGCSSQRDQAQGNYDYVTLQERAVLIVPEGMTSVAQNPQFSIPQSEVASGPVGRQISIRSPSQVMPFVPGSRIEEGNRESRIWFDAIEDMNNVADWVWQELIALIEADDISIESMDEMSRIQTGQIESEQGTRSSGGFWATLARRNRVELTATYNVAINMQAPAHGRSAMVEVEAKDITWLEGGQPQAAPALLQRQLEANFLNDLGMRMQRNFEQQRVAEVRATRALRHAESPQGEAAYALDANFEAGWVLMPGVFEYLGFEVEDLSQTDGIYYVDYQPGGQRGFFSRLAFWRSQEEGLLGLPRGSGYEFQVDEVDGVFYIVIRHNDELLDEEVMDELFPVFAEAFSEHAD